MIFPFNEQPAQGWQCPVCKRVYAPGNVMCFFCGGENKAYTGTGTEEKINVVYRDEKSCDADRT